MLYLHYFLQDVHQQHTVIYHFDYSQVLTKEFRFGTGRSIPLTFERSVNVSGSITADGKYFVYASNKERNNFDIYLRALNNIKTVRLTIHPARDFAPDVSPDGKCVHLFLLVMILKVISLL